MALKMMKLSVATPARVARRSVVVKAEATKDGAISVPEWAKPAEPVLKALASDSITFNDAASKVTSSDVYQKYVKEFAEGPIAAQATGWQRIPETINGRAAMIGFVAAALAELLGAGSILNQAAALPQSVLTVLALITVGSLVPIVKGTKGDYLASLQDTYTLPAGVFTQENEKLHGRIAMLGLFSLILVELLTGRALL